MEQDGRAIVNRDQTDLIQLALALKSRHPPHSNVSHAKGL